MENTDTPSDWLPPLPCTLDSKFIRVLRIAKPVDPNDQEIVCRIKTINIAEDTNFAALSYVWGVSPTFTKTIRCNGNIVAVGTNCWSALWHLRNGYYSDDPSVSGGSLDIMTIWVDSICIDQQNVKEKESQLRLMADIYSLARQVYVWLGEGTTESDAAIEHLRTAGFQKDLVEVGEHQYEIPQSKHFYFWQGWKMFTCQMANFQVLRWKSYTEFLSPLLPRNMPCDPTAFRDICSRTWAIRIWTFQEILLSPRPLLCCGKKTLSWRSFIHTITCFALTSEPALSAGEHRWTNILRLWATVQDFSKFRNTARCQRFTLQSYIGDYDFFTLRIRLAFIMSKIAALHFIVLTILFGLIFLCTSSAWAVTFAVLLSTYILGFFFSLISLFLSPKWKHLADRENRRCSAPVLLDVRDAIIYEIATRKVTNPRDKSFGMRAVLSKIGLQLDDPDYDTDIYLIYRELSVGLLCWSKSLNFLLFCDSSTTSTEPSWMPSWTMDPDKSWLNRNSLVAQGGYRAVFFRTQGFCYLTENEELVVCGVHVCRISWSCGRFYETGSTYHASDEQSHLYNISMIQDLMRRYREWTPATDADRHHTLLYWERNKLPEKDKQGLKEWGQMMRRTSVMRDASTSALSYLKSHPRCFEFHVDMFNNLVRRGRTLFLTQPGILGVGNGPANSQVSDLVTLVAGVSKPLILESRGARYRLKGFAHMEYEQDLASRARGLNTSEDPSRDGWEDLGPEMQPRDKIVIY